jgi:hypothetical protein
MLTRRRLLAALGLALLTPRALGRALAAPLRRRPRALSPIPWIGHC